MLPYCLIRPLAFALDPESAHNLTFAALGALQSAGLVPAYRPSRAAPVNVMGLEFPNRVGLAAGLDKNGKVVDALASWGFGFLEIGTITPRPQPGNPKPRLFRIPEVQGIVNRMGFNNDGVDALINNIRNTHFKGILGVNIGKNFDTPIERAADDYLACLDKVYDHASYVAINISSPNTKDLRQLQGESELDALLGQLKTRQTELAERHGRYVPLALKIAPDLDEAQIVGISDALKRHHLDAVIATNTTISREGVAHLRYANEAGGLSGGPVFARSTEVVRSLAKALAGELPIIAVGGITDGARASAKIEAGAALVQLYSGLIYRGPELVSECIGATDRAASRKSPETQ